MLISINYKSGKPPYLQIIEQISHAAAAGALSSGEILPTIRSLAERLEVNRNTVAKAYAELERNGVIETHTGRGSFVRENQSGLRKALREELVEGALDEAIVKARQVQISDMDLRQLLERRLKEFNRKPTNH